VHQPVRLFVRAYRPRWNGESGWAAVLVDGQGHPGQHRAGASPGSVLAERSGYHAGKSFAGASDYRAVIAGLEDASALGIALIVVMTSSGLVRDQMTNQRPVLGAEFLPLVRRVDCLVKQVGFVGWELVPANGNLAGPLAREAYLAGPVTNQSLLRSGSSGTNGRTG